MSTTNYPLGRICNPTALNISIYNAMATVIRITNPHTHSGRIANPTELEAAYEDANLILDYA